MKYAALFFILFIVLFFIIFRIRKTKKINNFLPTWRIILLEWVSFYVQLNDSERKEFEQRILKFINTTKITGINTKVEDIDRVLVASAAIIPVFSFKDWEYWNLKEVLLYPNMFSEDYSIDTKNSSVMGMVGSGVMNRKMILVKEALRQGFKNAKDKKNVAIHEFTHLIDMADGTVDGIPEVLVNKQFAIPWLELIKTEIEQIREERSDINAYGGVSETEFFPVITEYFFERPKLLKSKHPELYNLLEEIFKTDLSKKYKKITKSREIGRNDHCPCGSGEKFKNCCLRKNRKN